MKPQNLPCPYFLRNHFIYFNPHKRCWSAKALQSDESARPRPIVKGRVTGHADRILGFNATPKVSESGRQRVIRTGRQNVHAGLICKTLRVVTTGLFHVSDTTPRVTYNPYSSGYFVDASTGAVVRNLPVVLFGAGRVYYSDRIIRCGDNHFLDSATCADWLKRNEYWGPIDTSMLTIGASVAGRTGCTDLSYAQAGTGCLAGSDCPGSLSLV